MNATAEMVRETIRGAHRMAYQAWEAAGGCAQCRGLGYVERNVSGTLDYSDWQHVPCDAGAKCSAHLTGQYRDAPEYQWAANLEESYKPREMSWARSLTTKGRACGVEGVIVEVDRSAQPWSGVVYTSVKIRPVAGPAVWTKKFVVVPERAGEVFALRLSWCTNSKDVERLSYDARTDDERAACMVRHDELAQSEPVPPAIEECYSWTLDRHTNTWAVVPWDRKATPALGATVPVRSRDGRIKWVTIGTVARGLGFPS